MIQSTSHSEPNRSLHVAIIMDGSGRWATRQGSPREEGHRVATAAVRRTVEAAEHLGVGTLTLFAFSGDNWRRPSREVSNLMHIFEEYFRRDVPGWVRSGIRLSVVGRRDRFAPQLQEAIEIAEQETAAGEGLHLRIALDYSGRDSILQAARLFRRRAIAPTREAFADLLGEITNSGGPTPDIDLLIRTGGELRLSDFMLWESAYAELIFSDRLWPDFSGADLVAALCEFRTRDRRFGRVEEPVQVESHFPFESEERSPWMKSRGSQLVS